MPSTMTQVRLRAGSPERKISSALRTEKSSVEPSVRRTQKQREDDSCKETSTLMAHTPAPILPMLKERLHKNNLNHCGYTVEGMYPPVTWELARLSNLSE